MRGGWKSYIGLLAMAVVLIAIGLGVPRENRSDGQPAIDPILSPFGIGNSGCRSDPANLAPPASLEGRPSNPLHTCGKHIVDSQGREVRITGVNWSGMEYSGYAPGGLGVRNWQEIMDQVAALGYNTVRLPFSSEALEPRRQVGNVNFALNPDLEGLTALEVLDTLVMGARERGLKVILDRHQPTSAGRTKLWYSKEVSEVRWIADWRMLAMRYYGNDTVVGFDLHNEPNGEATWGSGDLATDWRLAAERAGNAVLEVNPYLLIFVEGIENHEGGHYWWGGNLSGVRNAPVGLRVPNRVVYSPHDYGPAVAGQSWFSDPRFPANLPEVWDRYWGYIHREGIAPVVVGEFGGYSFGDDPDGQWQRALVDYLRSNQIGALVWSLNPSWDTGGVFSGDWLQVDLSKQQGYHGMLAPPIDLGFSGVFGKARMRPRVMFRPEGQGGDPGEVAFSFRILNDGPSALDLSRVELRYSLDNGGSAITPGRVSSETGGLGDCAVQSEYVSGDGGQDGYVRVTFGDCSRVVERYRASGYVTVRVKGAVPTPVPRAGGVAVRTRVPRGAMPSGLDLVTLYLDGQGVWGSGR